MREKARTIAFKNSPQDGLLDHVTISTVGQPRQQELDKRGPHKHDVLLKLHGQLQMSCIEIMAVICDENCWHLR